MLHMLHIVHNPGIIFSSQIIRCLPIYCGTQNKTKLKQSWVFYVVISIYISISISISNLYLLSLSIYLFISIYLR